MDGKEECSSHGSQGFVTKIGSDTSNERGNENSTSVQSMLQSFHTQKLELDREVAEAANQRNFAQSRLDAVEAKNAKYVERIEALNRKEAEMDRARSEVSKEMDKIDKETDQYLKQMSELEQRMIDLGIQEKEFDNRVHSYRLQMKQHADEQEPALKEIDGCYVNELETQLRLLQEERERFASVFSNDDLENMMHHDYDEKLMMEIDALRKQLAQKQWDAGQIQQELDTMAAMKAELPKKMDILKKRNTAMIIRIRHQIAEEEKKQKKVQQRVYDLERQVFLLRQRTKLC